jgi:hypothetical protein
VSRSDDIERYDAGDLGDETAPRDPSKDGERGSADRAPADAAARDQELQTERGGSVPHVDAPESPGRRPADRPQTER